jgi:hypothetical protein
VDQYKTSFRVPGGHYEFRVGAFGLHSTSSLLMRYMHAIFGRPVLAFDDECRGRQSPDGLHRPMLGKFVQVYMDDILIFSRTMADHLIYVRMVLETLRSSGGRTSEPPRGHRCFVAQRRSMKSWSERGLSGLHHAFSKKKIIGSEIPLKCDVPAPRERASALGRANIEGKGGGYNPCFGERFGSGSWLFFQDLGGLNTMMQAFSGAAPSS